MNKHEAQTWFQEYCEPEDLILETNLFRAKEYITNTIIDKQKHLDLIISDWDFGGYNPHHILGWLRESSEIYSNKNFQARAMPFLLIEDSNQQSSYISKGFDGVIRDFPNSNIQISYTIKSAIRAWRYALADDLDLIGLDPATLKHYPQHRASFLSYHKLQVLSRYFVDSKSTMLNYVWSTADLDKLNNSNQQFVEKIGWANRTSDRYIEKEFHKFFLLNPTFIKGENFHSNLEEMLYEKHLYKNNSRRYDEPDFINKPLVHSLRAPEIFEVKLQNQRFLRYGKTNFLSKAKKSFEQVKRYRNYFNSTDPNNLYYIRKFLGREFSKYDFTLLMGSQDEKLENIDLIEQLKSDFDFDDINLITYEELLQRHLRMFNRLQSFYIF